MKCSTEASTGVLFSDLRYVDSPGACIVAPCMVGICAKAKAQAKVARFQTGYRGYVGVVGLSWFDDSRGRWAGPRGCILASRWMRCWAKALATRLWRCWGSVGVELHVEAVVMAKYES